MSDPPLWLALHNPHSLKTLIIPLQFQSLEFRGVDIEFDIKMPSTTISCMPAGAGFWGVTWTLTRKSKPAPACWRNLSQTFSFHRGSTAKNLRTESNCHQLSTVKLWYITKSLIVFTPEIVRYMKKDLDRTKRHYSKHVSPVPWVCVISRFHCKKLEVKSFYTFESVLYPKEILKTK